MLSQIYKEEAVKLFGSLAVNNSLKENGIMQDTTKLIEAKFDLAAAENVAPVAPVELPADIDDEGTWFEGEDMAAILAQPTPELQAAKAQEIIAASATMDVKLTEKETAVFREAHTQLGLGDDVTLTDMVEATKTPIKPLTKKQQKQQKHLMKNLQNRMRGYQRQGQASHIMNKLFQHSIRTPEQARQVHATQLAKSEITGALGQRQADAFFQADPDTKCHDFFPKATIEANPTLMTDLQGQSRTLAQVYEYYIYKHFMLLTQKANAELEKPLDTEVNWAEVGDVPKYIPFETKDEEAGEATSEAEETAQEV